MYYFWCLFAQPATGILPVMVNLSFYCSGAQDLLMSSVQPSPAIGRIWSYWPLQLSVGGTSHEGVYPPVMVLSSPSLPVSIVRLLHPLEPSSWCTLDAWMFNLWCSWDLCLLLCAYSLRILDLGWNPPWMVRSLCAWSIYYPSRVSDWAQLLTSQTFFLPLSRIPKTCLTHCRYLAVTAFLVVAFCLWYSKA